MRTIVMMALVVVMSVAVAHACGGMATVAPPPFPDSSTPTPPGALSTMGQPPGSGSGQPGTTTGGVPTDPSTPGLPTDGTPDGWLTSALDEVIL